MTKAKCFKCGGSAIADTYEQAKNLINHAVGLSRGIKCGDNYNMVKEIKPKITNPKPVTKVTPKPVVTNTPKEEKTKSSTSLEKPKEKSNKTKSSL